MTWVEGSGNVFDYLAALQLTVVPGSGKVRSSAYPVEGMADFPFWQNMLAEGSRIVKQNASWLIGFHTVKCELHLQRGDLRDNEKELRKFVRPYYLAIFADHTLGGAVEHVTEMRYSLVSWTYSSQDRHVGIEFLITFKVSELIT